MCMLRCLGIFSMPPVRLYKLVLLAQLFRPIIKINVMNSDQNQKAGKNQPEDGNDQDLNLTNNDASLARQTPKQADSPTMSDNGTSGGNDNLTQSVMNGSEINPEYGDAADPTFETL